MEFDTRPLGAPVDVRAPDGSEIRVLLGVAAGALCHCTLHPGQASRAIEHRTVEEIWYCLAGHGQIWRRQGDREEITDLVPGVALTIPLRTAFQFRNVGTDPLRLVIATMPPWPGADEAVRVPDRWPPAV
jgi:mannose-6-phosphate isomerase-like protein (cupin superfamily)